MENKIEETYKKASGIIMKVSASSIDSLKAIADFSLKVGGDFETGMAKVAASTGATGANLKALTDIAAEMGATTKFTAAESAEALTFLSIAGWNTHQMMSGLPAVMDFAAASGESLKAVTDVLTESLTDFGLNAQQSGHYADVLAASALNANTSIGVILEGFQAVSPIAGEMKYSIEDTAAALGVLAQNSIVGEQAGAQLGEIFTNLAAPSSEAAKAMQELNLQITNSDGSMKPLSETIGNLRNSFGGLSDSQKSSYASMLAGKDAMSGLLALVNTSEAEYTKLSEAISKSDGSLQKITDTMNDNLQGKLSLMQSSLESLGISIYDKFAAPFKEAAESATNNITGLSNSITDGKLSASMDTIAAAFANTAENVIALLAETVLPALINGLAWIADNSSTATGVIVGLTVAFAAYKAIISITKIATEQLSKVTLDNTLENMASEGKLKLSTIAYQLLQGKITVTTAKTLTATTAQHGFNAAFNASVIGAVVTVLATLVGVAVAFSASAREGSKKVKELNDEMKNLEDNNTAELTKTQAQIHQINVKADRYHELSQKIKRTAEEEKELQYIMEDLKAILPENTEFINKQTGEYNNLSSAVETATQAMLDQVKVKAEQSVYEKQVEQLITLRQQLEVAEKELERKPFMEELGESTLGALTFGITTAINDISANVSVSDLKKQIANYEASTAAYETNSLTAAKKADEQRLADAAEADEKDLEQTEDHNKAKGDIMQDAYVKQHLLERANQRTWLLENIATFEQGKEELDRARTRGLVSDEQYYNELEALLKEHNISDIGENQKYYDELITGRQQANQKSIEEQARALEEQRSLQEDEFKIWTDSANQAVDEYKSQCDSIISQRESMEEKLSSFGPLFEIEKNEETGEEVLKLQNINEQTAQLLAYRQQLSQLQAAGASSDFMNEVLGMDVGQASKFMEELLNSGGIDEFLKAFEEKQKVAAEISQQVYETQLESLNQNFVDKFQGIMGNIPEDMSLLGQDAVQGFVDGLDSKLKEIAEKGFQIGSTVKESLKQALDIHSPSKITMELGGYTGEGFIMGLNKYKEMAYKTADGISSSVIAGLGNTNVSDIYDKINAVSQNEMSMRVQAFMPYLGGQGNTSNKTSNITNHNSVTIDAKNVREFNDIVEICRNANQISRAR